MRSRSNRVAVELRNNIMTRNNAQFKHTILIGVCGGIAAYKTVEVVSRLRQEGHDVHVVMSESACEFVAPLTFAALSGNKALTRTFPDATHKASDDLYPHLYPATRADVFVLMPATANMIGRIAQGLGDEIVSVCALSLPAMCRRYFCPSMNVEMWEQSSVQDGVRAMEERGWIRLGPESGVLACGMEGAGRMVEPAEVLDRIRAALLRASSLSGKRVLILSGPTREHLDPIRYLGNAGSGRMGKALAEEAADRGARVTFVTGPVHDAFLPRREGIEILPVTSAEQMLETARKPFKKADVTIFAAAVADYRPTAPATEKRKKRTSDWSLRLTATPDIAATLSATKKKKQRTIGFALQTGDGLKEARNKLKTKNLDAIVLNHPEAMDADTGAFTFIEKNQTETPWGTIDKRACAGRIWDAATALWAKG